jgi:hypothetical protein
VRLNRLNRRPLHLHPEAVEAVYRLLPALQWTLPHQGPTLAEADHEIRTAFYQDDLNVIAKPLLEPMRGRKAAKSATENEYPSQIIISSIELTADIRP